MTKKVFFISIILSVVLAIILPVIAFALGITAISYGFPLKWTTFSFLGSHTDYTSLILDIIFWFLVIWGIWKVFKKTSKKKK